MAADGTVLYVGKAKNLKNRIASYRQFKQLPHQKKTLVSVAETVVCHVYNSEIEALLAEAEFIKLYRPEYNILLKDDRTPLYIVVTQDPFPRVITTRRQNIIRERVKGETFGPFQSGYMAKEVLRTIRPAFRWCNEAGKPNRGKSQRACFYRHLHLCSGACTGEVDKKEYQKMIRRLKQFLRGETKVVQRQLKQQIEELAKEQKFEAAEDLRLELAAIERVTEPTYHLKPDIMPVLASVAGTEKAWKKLEKTLAAQFGFSSAWKLNRIECFDVSNFTGKYASVSMVVLTQGLPDPNHYRLFNIRSKQTPDDYHMLQEALTRRQYHPEWGLPEVVVIDGGRGQVNAVKEVWKLGIPVIGIAKDPDRLVIPQENGEFVFLPISELGDAGKLIQQARDEAHRFAKKQTKRRLLKRDLPVDLIRANKKR